MNDPLGVSLLVAVVGLLAKAVWDLRGKRDNGHNGYGTLISDLNARVEGLEENMGRVRDHNHRIANKLGDIEVKLADVTADVRANWRQRGGPQR